MTTPDTQAAAPEPEPDRNPDGRNGRPDVLLIQADQFRSDCLGCAGNNEIDTPNLDGLAADGVRYPNAFCTFPICTPSRYSLLSGRYARQHAGLTNRSTLAPGIDTIPRFLSRAGYRTAAVGKMHFTPTYLDVGYQRMRLAEQDGPGRYDDDYHRELAAAGLAPVTDLLDQEAGFRATAPAAYWDSYGAGTSNLPEAWHSTTWIGREACQAIAEWGSREDTGGNLLHVSFIKPHHPFDPPAPWASRYDPSALHPPAGWTERLPEPDQPYRDGYFDFGPPLTLGRLRVVLAHYYATISHLDHWVGQLLNRLRASGRYDRTLIIFTADHGEYLGFHHLLLKYGPMYDPVVKVPLIVKYPSDTGRRGRVDERLVSLIDVAPTVARLTRARPATALPGQDLLSQSPERECVFAESHHDGLVLMARTGAHKLLLADDPGRTALFDLAADPLESDNRIGDSAYTGVADRLRAALGRWAVREACPPAYADPAAPIIGAARREPDPGQRSALRRDFAARVAEYLNDRSATQVSPALSDTSGSSHSPKEQE